MCRRNNITHFPMSSLASVARRLPLPSLHPVNLFRIPTTYRIFSPELTMHNDHTSIIESHVSVDTDTDADINIRQEIMTSPWAREGSWKRAYAGSHVAIAVVMGGLV